MTVALLSDDEAVRFVQTRLKVLGYFHGAIEGNFGPLTREAFERALPLPEGLQEPPWLEVMTEALGWHEKRDNARLRAWLKRDGKSLGDPGSLPWCGDAVDTAFRVGLPGEPRPGALGENPYWALNWRLFGRALEAPMLGCVAVKPRQGGGHVCLVVGQGAGGELYCMGGNQANELNVSRYSRASFTDFRWPSTYALAPQPLPRMSPGSVPQASSEA